MSSHLAGGQEQRVKRAVSEVNCMLNRLNPDLESFSKAKGVYVVLVTFGPGEESRRAKKAAASARLQMDESSDVLLQLEQSQL